MITMVITDHLAFLHLSSSIFFKRNRLACPIIAHLNKDISWSLIAEQLDGSLPKEIIGITADSPGELVEGERR